MRQISKIDKRQTTYKGQYVNGYFNENYLFTKGTEIIIADAYVNAKNIMSAVNKLARKLGLHTYNDMDELLDDIKCGYYTVEEANYYDEKTDSTYKYYISTIYNI